jgi:hypothetical protein
MLLSVTGIDQWLPVASSWLPELALSTLLLAFRVIHYFQGRLLLKACFKPTIVGKC